MLIHKQHVLLETCVQVRLKTKLTNHGVVVAVDMSVDTVHALEDLADQRRERLGEGDTLSLSATVPKMWDIAMHTNFARQYLFVVDV